MDLSTASTSTSVEASIDAPIERAFEAFSRHDGVRTPAPG
jgi:hypothetical protein